MWGSRSSILQKPHQLEFGGAQTLFPPTVRRVSVGWCVTLACPWASGGVRDACSTHMTQARQPRLRRWRSGAEGSPACPLAAAQQAQPGPVQSRGQTFQTRQRCIAHRAHLNLRPDRGHENTTWWSGVEGGHALVQTPAPGRLRLCGAAPPFRLRLSRMVRPTGARRLPVTRHVRLHFTLVTLSSRITVVRMFRPAVLVFSATRSTIRLSDLAHRAHRRQRFFNSLPRAPARLAAGPPLSILRRIWLRTALKIRWTGCKEHLR